MTDLKAFTFGKGAHETRDEGMCVMEAVAYLAGESHSDAPQCACLVITRLAIWLNDTANDALRQELLGALPWRIVGTRSPAHELQRAFMASDWAVREVCPRVFRRVGLKTEADILEGLPLTDELAELRSRPPVIAAPVGSLVPTGEVRPPKGGEWFSCDSNNGILRSFGNMQSPPRAIYRRIEPAEHGEFTHVLRLVGRDIPPRAGQLWCNWEQPNGHLMMTSNDFTSPMRWVYELVPLTPAAPDDGFSAWWSGLEKNKTKPWTRYINGSVIAGETQARAIWKAARKSKEKDS